MSIVRTFTTVSAALVLAGAGLVAAAAPAAADQVWYQGFERASADAPCAAPADETPWQDSFSGQREWTPSWAQWARGGEGGFVCERYIVWAKSGSTFPSAFCVQGSPIEWVDFRGGWSLPVGSAVYDNADCATGLEGFSGYDIVYAPAGWDPSTLCLMAFGTDEDLLSFGYDVWACKEYV